MTMTSSRTATHLVDPRATFLWARSNKREVEPHGKHYQDGRGGIIKQQS